MPKKTLQRFMPKPDTIKKHPQLQILGEWLYDPNIWHLNRRSAAGAFAIGLFMAFMPVPSQMILAALAAVLFQVNLPLSVLLVWISNPITVAPMFYFCYWVGALILGEQPIIFQIELSWSWMLSAMELIGPPFLLGCLICGTSAAILGYIAISQLWRYMTLRRYKRRRENRAKQK